MTASVATYLRIAGTVLAAVATSLAPTYGKEGWYAIIVGVASGLALVAPSILPAKTTSTLPQQKGE
jgi:hypothetical protein